MYAENRVPTSAMLLRRAAVEAVGPSFGDYRMGLDWEMWLRIGTRFPVAYLRVRDNAVRVHPSSVTSGSSEWGAMHLEFTHRADELVARNMPGYSLPARVRARRLRYVHLKVALDRVQHGDREGARRSLRAALSADGRTLLDPRTGVVLAGLAGGDRARGAVARLRALESRAQLGTRLRELRHPSRMR